MSDSQETLPTVPSEPTSHPLAQLLDLVHQAREARSRDELVFLLVNDTRALLHYRQAVLWTGGAVRGLSGVVELDRNAPYAQWADRLCRHLAQQAGPAQPVDRTALPPELADPWADWLPEHALWLPLPAAVGGGLLLATDDAWPPAAQALLQEWLHGWAHAWAALQRPARRWWGSAPPPHSDVPAAAPRWWRRRPVQVALAALVALCLPVRLTVLAPAELVAADALVVRAPLDGVVERFHVQPNQAVKAGELLFSFDQAPISSRLDVARQALATAQVEYRQSAQLSLADARNKGQLAVLQGKIEERRAEAAFLADQFQRSRVTAPRDGVALFDDPSEWEGRPVRTGERILRVVDPHRVEVEAWLPVGDAIPLPAGAPLQMYLAATPLDPVHATLRYMAHDPVQRPDGHYAYRVRATLAAATAHRIGLQGTARLEAGWVPLGYWVLRRPLAVIRQALAL
ncbi:MAG: HlyD family efflux transporter periplasmic adaptor subunit [Burkholderiales bacterium]